MMPSEAWNLPWQIQVSLASGYGAYFLAYVGIRSHHKTVDIAFITVTFGLVATLVIWTLSDRDIPVAAVGLAALLVTVTIAVLWRGWGKEWTGRIIHRWDLSWSNDDPSALATICGDRHLVSQIAVQLKDGTWLRCDDASRFSNYPPVGRPVVIGQSGDVALYLTHEMRPGEDARELSTVFDPDWGYRMTYVPASQVQQMTIRFMP